MDIPGYLVLAAIIAAISLMTVLRGFWMHSVPRILLGLGSGVWASALIVDASHGGHWLSAGGWRYIFGIGGMVLVVAGLVAGRLLRLRASRPTPPPNSRRPASS